MLEPRRVVAREVRGWQREQVIQIELLLLQPELQERGDPRVQQLADHAVFVTSSELDARVPTSRPPDGRWAGRAPVVRLGDPLVLADPEGSEHFVGDPHVRYPLARAPCAAANGGGGGGGSGVFHFCPNNATP